MADRSNVIVGDSTSSDFEKELMFQFTVALHKIRYELEKNLSEIDVLNSKKLEGVVSLFNRRLIIFQSEFLQYLKDYNETVDKPVFDPPFHTENEVAKLSAVVLGSSLAAAILLTTLVVSTSGFWFWTTSVTLGGLIGAKVGIPAGPATAGVSIAVGAAVGGVTVVASRPMRRKMLKKMVLHAFDNKTSEQLQEWAAKHIKEKING